MSYRAFKRLLGETSLERKCRFLFGAATLLLITASFWWYARQTEDLAYEQISTAAHLLVNTVISRPHEKLYHAADTSAGTPPASMEQWEELRHAMEQFAEEQTPGPVAKYEHRLIKPNARKPENTPGDSFEHELLQKYLNDPN